MEETTHTAELTIANSNQAVSYALLNVSNLTDFNIMEVMLTPINALSVAEVYFCNASYVAGKFRTHEVCTFVSTITDWSWNNCHT